MVNFMLYVFHHNGKKKKNTKEPWRNLSLLLSLFFLSLKVTSPGALHFSKGGSVLYNSVCLQHIVQHPAPNKPSTNVAAILDKMPD